MARKRTSAQIEEITPAQIEAALVAARTNPYCRGCGTRMVAGGTGYCGPCESAVNRLVDRGVYFADHPSDWRDLIRAERGRS